MKTTRLLVILSSALISIYFTDHVWGGTFGSGANTFVIDFVTVGDAGNSPDITGNPNPAGSVAYDYRIGKYEISEQMIDKANAVGGLFLTKDTRGPDKPATRITWNEAARFVNWLNTSTGNQPAYKFALNPGDAGYTGNAQANTNILEWNAGDGAAYDAANPYRNALARFFLPSYNEWYKAAYYDGDNDVYYDYATGSSIAPVGVLGGTAPGTAVYTQPDQAGPADITNAGGLSPYGTMAQNGNIHEWEESDWNLVNGPSTDRRGRRGGYWTSPALNLVATNRLDGGPTSEANFAGFRVAAVIPEPSTLVLVALAGLGLVCRRAR